MSLLVIVSMRTCQSIASYMLISALAVERLDSPNLGRVQGPGRGGPAAHRRWSEDRRASLGVYMLVHMCLYLCNVFVCLCIEVVFLCNSKRL